MGMMIDGKWTAEEPADALTNRKGEFVRAESHFRSRIAADGSTPHPPQAGRYHFFLSHS